MANEVRMKYESPVQVFTITLDAIATLTGRLALQVTDTNGWQERVLFARIQSGSAAPAATGTYKFYLVRDDEEVTTPYRSEGYGTAEAAVTSEPLTAKLIGQINVTNDADKQFFGDWVFRTSSAKFSVVFWNDTDQSTGTVAADHFLRHRGQNLEVADAPSS